MSADESVIRQVLEGYDYPGDPIRCAECGVALRDGARCGIVARRPHDTAEWAVVTTYCVEDTPESAPETLPVPAVLAAAEVGSIVNTGHQTHMPCFIDVSLLDTALHAPEMEA